ncbi:STAS/SEC14 domain-containing protein [Stigmatella sp. ncwal1]|uniref:STAS/SEC14 domain-containing protein n=1 Tax=Stigmatella ashevillensis TaxID=2995309 RepID=A0ABT5DAZ0_9BACT|nr:STAS/SEC14 domain-containing protein [Stigmatella ashevillena]MDC0710270.1 STAS/SEC14 domain-containing protein [Stigmatella ashevillena]
MGAERHFGPHTLSLEEPGIVRLTTKGHLQENELREMIVPIREFKERHDALYLMVDARHGTGFSAKARKAINEDRSLVPYTGVVIFGASFAMRAISHMMTRAGVLMGRRPTYQTVFTETEEEARAWLAVQHAARATGSAPEPQ